MTCTETCRRSRNLGSEKEFKTQLIDNEDHSGFTPKVESLMTKFAELDVLLKNWTIMDTVYGKRVTRDLPYSGSLDLCCSLSTIVSILLM